MRKLLTMTAVALVASYATASAATIELKPYVGLETGYMKTHSEEFKVMGIKINSMFEDNQYTGALVAGARVSKNFGFEAFLQRGREESKNVNLEKLIPVMPQISDYVSYKVKAKSQLDYAWGLDFNGYLPLTEKVELVGTVGLGSYNFTHKIGVGVAGTNLPVNISQDEDNVFGLRLGLGVDYKLNDKWSLRGTYRYVKLDPGALEWTDTLNEVTVGLRYAF